MRSMSDPFLEVELDLKDSDLAASLKSILNALKLQMTLASKEVEEFS